jgi:hypothetical protein
MQNVHHCIVVPVLNTNGRHVDLDMLYLTLYILLASCNYTKRRLLTCHLLCTLSCWIARYFWGPQYPMMMLYVTVWHWSCTGLYSMPYMAGRGTSCLRALAEPRSATCMESQPSACCLPGPLQSVWQWLSCLPWSNASCWC